jgi:uncharacterized protein (DUF849 family)
VLIKAAINGGRSKAEHPAVPVSPDEQAAAVLECLKTGADAVHLHVRATSSSDDQSSSSISSGHRLQLGKESLYAEDVATTLMAVQAICQKARIGSLKARVGVSTGAWILPDPAARLQAVAEWKVWPGFASVNFSEEGAAELANLLLSQGVDIEAGLCDADAAQAFVKTGLAASCIRVLLEPQEQEMERALETVRAIEKILDSSAAKHQLSQLPLLLHGAEATAWPMMDEAIARGYDVRIGLEDTLVLPDGRLARDNAELVTEGMRRSSGH